MRGRLVQRQLAVTLSCMEALLRVQEHAMERRARCSDDAQSQDLNGRADPLREPEVGAAMAAAVGRMAPSTSSSSSMPPTKRIIWALCYHHLSESSASYSQGKNTRDVYIKKLKSIQVQHHNMQGNQMEECGQIYISSKLDESVWTKLYIKPIG